MPIELLASHNNADEPSIPSPIAPLLYLSVSDMSRDPVYIENFNWRRRHIPFWEG